VYYTCCARLLVIRGAAVEPCHQVAVGGAGGGKFVVAVLEVLAAVEELLFEFGDSFLEGAGFVGAGEAGVVEDLFAEDFGQPLGELGVLMAEAFVVCAQVGEVGQQRTTADAGAGRVRFGFGGEGEDLGAQVVVAIQERAIDARGPSDRGDGDLVAVGAESVEGIDDFAATAIAVAAPRRAASRGFVGCVVTVGLPSSGRVLATLWWVGPGARSGGSGARPGRLPRSVGGRCRRAH